MSYYNVTGIDRLKREARERFERLLASLDGPKSVCRGTDVLALDASKIRMAVDDFHTILKELRRLK